MQMSMQVHQLGDECGLRSPRLARFAGGLLGVKVRNSEKIKEKSPSASLQGKIFAFCKILGAVERTRTSTPCGASTSS